MYLPRFVACVLAAALFSGCSSTTATLTPRPASSNATTAPTATPVSSASATPHATATPTAAAATPTPTPLPTATPSSGATPTPTPIPAPTQSGSSTIVEYVSPSGEFANPECIALGPDNNLYVTEPGTDDFLQVTTGGTFKVQSFAAWTNSNGQAANFAPAGVAAGSDGRMWFAGEGGGFWAESTSLSDITFGAYGSAIGAGGGEPSQPYGITSGPSGNLWLTDLSVSQAIVISPANPTASPTRIDIGSNAEPIAIAEGNDGNLWVSEDLVAKIARVTPGGTVTQFNISGQSEGIAAGPDGALWFTEYTEGANKIGRLTTGGSLTEYTIPTADAVPAGIAAGTDGALWFAEAHGNKIGRITTAGVITEYPVPTASAEPFNVAAGPDSAMWFTEFTAGKVGRIPLDIVNATAQTRTSGATRRH